MGQLLSSIRDRSPDQSVPDVYFDFENPRPTEQETALFQHLYQTLLVPIPALINSLQQYKSASEEIRRAIGSPTEENEDAAWAAIKPIVLDLRTYYDWSQQLEEQLPALLETLCAGDNVTANLKHYQTLTKLLADILEFVFEFDYLKMRTPSMQNDFSYYRRMLSRGKFKAFPISSRSEMRAAVSEDDLANRISLFIAYPTPMLRHLIVTMSDFVESRNYARKVSECLVALWAVCYTNVAKKSSSSPPKSPAAASFNLMRHDTTGFSLKVMVIAIILYDHISQDGAFAKKSPIDIKASVKVIQNYGGKGAAPGGIAGESSNLMSLLRFNSKHLNDEATPGGVRKAVVGVQA